MEYQVKKVSVSGLFKIEKYSVCNDYYIEASDGTVFMAGKNKILLGDIFPLSEEVIVIGNHNNYMDAIAHLRLLYTVIPENEYKTIFKTDFSYERSKVFPVQFKTVNTKIEHNFYTKISSVMLMYFGMPDYDRYLEQFEDFMSAVENDILEHHYRNLK